MKSQVSARRSCSIRISLGVTLEVNWCTSRFAEQRRFLFQMNCLFSPGLIYRPRRRIVLLLSLAPTPSSPSFTRELLATHTASISRTHRKNTTHLSCGYKDLTPLFQRTWEYITSRFAGENRVLTTIFMGSGFVFQALGVIYVLIYFLSLGI